jgi:hypothetical protein
MKILNRRRRVVAEAKFADYQFGWEVEEVHHWHSAGGGDAFCRTVLFCGEAPGSPCVRGHFYVRFRRDRASIEECYAMIDGCLVGDGPVRANARRRAGRR